MAGTESPKTLLMIIKKKWLVDSIKGLGSGYLTHLSYKNEAIEPEVLEDIRNRQLKENVLGEILFLDQQEIRSVAKVEIYEINNFHTFIRFDLRLLEVSPFIRERFREITTEYACYYQKGPE